MVKFKAFSCLEKNFPIEVFSTLDVYKNPLVLNGLKWEQKLAYASDFTKQTSTIQKVAEMIWELELNQALVEVTTLLCYSDPTCQICFLWEIVFFTKACK